MSVTHERLLEWETAAESESNYGQKSPVEVYLQAIPWLTFLIGLFIALERKEAFLVALPLLILWGLSKPIEQWLHPPPTKQNTKINSENKTLPPLSTLPSSP